MSSAKKRTQEKGVPSSKSKKKRNLNQSDEEKESSGFLSSKYAEPPVSKIYNSRFSKKTPAELFRKDLISAMKLPDTEPLTPEDFWLIEDPWKPEWEKGVQVPVEPDALHTASARLLRRRNKTLNFRLPKKLIYSSQDKPFSTDTHIYSFTHTLADQTCRYDMDDVDLQWLSSLNEERNEFELQPIDELTFEKIVEEFEVLCHENVQESIRNENALAMGSDEDAVCDVCQSPDSEDTNEMVFCDSCNICVHQSCYGITKIPEGSWICRTCALSIRPQCVLCPIRGGAMKPTKNGDKWCHVSCAIWVPEVSIESAEKMEPIIKISHIPPFRWSLLCVFCNKKIGACIQCSAKSCKTAYHVTCASKEQLKMTACSKPGSDSLVLKSYCKKHNSDTTQIVNEGQKDSTVIKKEIKKETEVNSDSHRSTQEEKLQEKEADFFNYVSIDEVADVGQYDKDIVEMIYHYWKLKRTANFNRPLLPLIFPHAIMCSLEDNHTFNLVKKLVLLRRDLERVRNLSYMVTKREKMAKNWINCKEEIFNKQVQILESGEKLSKEDQKVILMANHGSISYDKKYTSDNGPSPHTLKVLNTLIGEEHTKTHLNGILKNSKKNDSNQKKSTNPYAKHYLNGLLKRSQRWLATVDRKKRENTFVKRQEVSKKKSIKTEPSEDAPDTSLVSAQENNQADSKLAIAVKTEVCDIETKDEAGSATDVCDPKENTVQQPSTMSPGLKKSSDNLDNTVLVDDILVAQQVECEVECNLQNKDDLLSADVDSTRNPIEVPKNDSVAYEESHSDAASVIKIEVEEENSSATNQEIPNSKSSDDEMKKIMAKLQELMPEEVHVSKEQPETLREVQVPLAKAIQHNINKFIKPIKNKVRKVSSSKESNLGHIRTKLISTESQPKIVTSADSHDDSEFDNNQKLNEIVDVLFGKNVGSLNSKKEFHKAQDRNAHSTKKNMQSSNENRKFKSIKIEVNRYPKGKQPSDDFSPGSSPVNDSSDKLRVKNFNVEKSKRFKQNRPHSKESTKPVTTNKSQNEKRKSPTVVDKVKEIVSVSTDVTCDTYQQENSNSSGARSKIPGHTSPVHNVHITLPTGIKPIVLLENLKLDASTILSSQSASEDHPKTKDEIFPSSAQPRKGSLTGYKIPKKVKTNTSENATDAKCTPVSPLKAVSSISTVVSLFPATNSYQVRPIYKGTPLPIDQKPIYSTGVACESQVAKSRDSPSEGNSNHQWKKMMSQPQQSMRPRCFFPNNQRMGSEFLPQPCGVGSGNQHWRRLRPSHHRPVRFDHRSNNHYT